MLRVLRAASLAMGNILQLDHISNIIDKHVGNVEKMLKQLDHFLTEVYSTVVVVVAILILPYCLLSQLLNVLTQAGYSYKRFYSRFHAQAYELFAAMQCHNSLVDASF